MKATFSAFGSNIIGERSFKFNLNPSYKGNDSVCFYSFFHTVEESSISCILEPNTDVFGIFNFKDKFDFKRVMKHIIEEKLGYKMCFKKAKIVNKDIKVFQVSIKECLFGCSQYFIFKDYDHKEY